MKCNPSVLGGKMAGERASVIFGETLWRHLCVSNCKNKYLGSKLATPKSPVAHSSGDPPCRGTEKTTLVRSPPVTEGLRKIRFFS
jgi:hypothetical protein